MRPLHNDQAKTTLINSIEQVIHSVNNFRQRKDCGLVVFHFYFDVTRSNSLLPHLMASKCILVIDHEVKPASLYSSLASPATSTNSTMGFSDSVLLSAREDQVPGHLELVFGGSEVCPDLW